MEPNENLNAEAEGLFDFFDSADEAATESVADAVDAESKPEEPADTTQDQTAQDDPAQEQAPDAKLNPEEPTEEEKRYQFWQSKYVELKQQTDQQVSQREQELSDYRPIAEYLASNPEALIKLKEQLEEPPSKEASLVPPEMPNKPSNFSLYEARNDPESESAKYEAATIEYNAQMVNYLAQKDAYREQKAQEREAYAQQQAEQAAQMERYKVSMLEAGLPATEFDEFNTIMNSPESLDPKNLIMYWNVLKGRGGEGMTQAQVKAKEFADQQQRMANTPPPAGGYGGESEEPLDDAALFNKAMLDYQRR